MYETNPVPMSPSSPPDPPPLEYAVAVGRPGILTALGVLSIVIGSIGLLGNAWGVLSSAGVLIAQSATGTSLATSGNAGSTPAGQITPADAAIIVGALGQSQALSETDRLRLVAALQRAEAPMVPPPAGSVWTVPHVAAQLQGSDVTNDDSGRTTHYDLGMSGDIWIEPGFVTLDAWPVSGKDVTTHVADDGGITVTPTSVPAAVNPFGTNPVPAATVLVTKAIEVLLSGVLLTAGILVVRDSPRGRAWHRRWAWTRLIVGVIGSAAVAWWMSSLFTSVIAQSGSGNTASPPPAGLFTAMALVSAGVNLLVVAAYPIAVLIVLRARGVRAYYANA